MAMKNKKINRHCPVPGCRTTKPHADNPIVQGLIRAFAPPEAMTLCARIAMAELSESICRDLREKKLFAWYSRLRQPEELYIRTLYALFIATDNELPHVLSGDRPNGLSPLYSEVNKLIFEGRGLLQISQPGLNHGTFKPIDILHDGAHASFRASMTCIGFARDPQNLPSPERYIEHLTRYCNYLDYMHGMFKSGKEKKDVLAGVISMHRPASASVKGRVAHSSRFSKGG
jgi:hypothetical protein